MGLFLQKSPGGSFPDPTTGLKAFILEKKKKCILGFLILCVTDVLIQLILWARGLPYM